MDWIGSFNSLGSSFDKKKQLRLLRKKVIPRNLFLNTYKIECKILLGEETMPGCQVMHRR